MAASVPRTVGILLSILMGALSVAEYTTRRMEVERLVGVLEAHGLAASDPDVVADVRRQTDTDRARIVAARGLLAVEADPGTLLDFPPQQRRRRALEGVERLKLARELAEEVGRRRPAFWEVHLVRGASTFLEQTRTRRPRLPSDDSIWETSLTLAHRLAPSRSESLRFLAAAYLSDWSRLDDERQARAIEVIEGALADPATLELLLDRWLRVAPSLQIALEVLPDSSGAWERVRRHHAQRSDWERYCLAHGRGDEALLRELQLTIAEIPDRIRRGDVSGARAELLRVLARAPIRGPFDSVLEGFLRLLPPGPASASGTEKLRKWLAWSTDLCLQGQCALDASLLDRLAGLAELHNPARAAEAAIIAGDLARAEAYERRSFRTASTEWAPYLLLKSRLLAARGLRAEAWETLSRVAPSTRARPEYAAAIAAVDGASINEIPAVSDARALSASAWSHAGRTSEILLLGKHVESRLEIDLASTTAGGGPVEILWNGHRASCRSVAGSGRLDFTPSRWLDVNRLVLVPLEETRLHVGAVRILAASRDDRQPPHQGRLQGSPSSPAS